MGTARLKATDLHIVKGARGGRLHFKVSDVEADPLVLRYSNSPDAVAVVIVVVGVVGRYDDAV